MVLIHFLGVSVPGGIERDSKVFKVTKKTRL